MGPVLGTPDGLPVDGLPAADFSAMDVTATLDSGMDSAVVGTMSYVSSAPGGSSSYSPRPSSPPTSDDAADGWTKFTDWHGL